MREVWICLSPPVAFYAVEHRSSGYPFRVQQFYDGPVQRLAFVAQRVADVYG